MTNALDLALANAAANAPKGEELHLENLDSIADPTIDEPQSIMHHTLLAADEIMSGWNELHSPKRRIQEQPHLIAYNDPQQDGLLLVNIKTVVAKTDLINSRLDALADMITAISTTITTAAQSMPQEPDLKHRSLEDWPLTTLINELVERENNLMPFYFELLKRIPPDLQSHVQNSMQGKYQSLGVLSTLCAAMSQYQQAQPQPQTAYEVGLSQSAEQRMDEAFHAATTPQTYTQAQLDNLRFNGQSSGITVEEIALYEKMKRQGTVIPQGIFKWDNSLPSR
tara:strand:+ start:1345 stop:2190 length:846 start_codon:yes stop_codon:yes gene_type:complete